MIKDLVPWAYDMYPDTVTVTGAESVVNEVDAVRGKITSNVSVGKSENSRSRVDGC